MPISGKARTRKGRAQGGVRSYFKSKALGSQGGFYQLVKMEGHL